MSLVDDVGSELVRSVWATLVNGTLVVAATWILSATLFRRSPAWLQAALWTLALLKFVVPCGPSLDYSVSRGLQIAAVEGGIIGWLASRPGALWVILGGIYLIGLGVLAARRLCAHRRLLVWARRQRLPSPEIVDEVDAAAARLGVRRLPDVRITGERVSPMIVLALRPILILPDWLEPAAREPILHHELAHLRRRDHWLLVAAALFSLCFYFWPPAWWAAARFRRALEAACDAWTVSRGALCPRTYARTLFLTARKVIAGPRPELALAICDRSPALERRIDALLRPPAPRALALALSLGLGAWGIVALAGAKAPECPIERVVVPPPCRHGP
jgi:beta-lactamase regulating signal transducer with metallopeptidase domain